MKKLFQLLNKKQGSAHIKTTYRKKTFTREKADLKTETHTYLTMPLVFDFTAYYDDNELENIPKDNPHENATVIANAEEIL